MSTSSKKIRTISCPRRQPGFTLGELLVTVAVVGIVLTVGVPSMTQSIRTNRLVTQTNSLVSALYVTRSEAIKRGARVTICKSDDGASCDNTLQWEDGWIVFVDTDPAGTVNLGTSDVLLRVNTGLAGGNTLRTADAHFQNFVSYLGSGRSEVGGVISGGAFGLCTSSGDDERTISISRTGRVSTDDPDTPSCP